MRSSIYRVAGRDDGSHCTQPFTLFTAQSYAIFLTSCQCTQMAFVLRRVDTTHTGYWYLWIHRSSRRFSTPKKKDTSFVGECPLSRYRSSIIRLPQYIANSPPFTFRLVRPHNGQAVQERYAAYGDRVGVRPVDDLIKGDARETLPMF